MLCNTLNKCRCVYFVQFSFVCSIFCIPLHPVAMTILSMVIEGAWSILVGHGTVLNTGCKYCNWSMLALDGCGQNSCKCIRLVFWILDTSHAASGSPISMPSSNSSMSSAYSSYSSVPSSNSPYPSTYSSFSSTPSSYSSGLPPTPPTPPPNCVEHYYKLLRLC